MYTFDRNKYIPQTNKFYRKCNEMDFHIAIWDVTVTYWELNMKVK